MDTANWKLTLSRKLTKDEWNQIGRLFDETPTTWDAEGNEYNMPMCLFVIKKVCPDVEAKEWKHEPITVLITSMGLPKKAYVIEHAMSFKYAADAAKKEWKEQYGYMGMRATVLSARLAKPRDLKGMM